MIKYGTHAGAWTDARAVLLQKLWSEGMSASVIAQRLGGVSRNAVIGKVHRMGLPGRAPTQKQRWAKPPRRVRRRAVSYVTQSEPHARQRSILDMLPTSPLPLPSASDVARLTLDQLEDRSTITQCRWPVGDPRQPGFGFCGCPAHTGLPYCADHARRAYAAPAVRSSPPKYRLHIDALAAPVSREEVEEVLA